MLCYALSEIKTLPVLPRAAAVLPLRHLTVEPCAKKRQQLRVMVMTGDGDAVELSCFSESHIGKRRMNIEVV